MTIKTLLRRAEEFYKLAASNDKTAFVYPDPQEGNSIAIVDASGKVKASINLKDFNGHINPELNSVRMFEIGTMVSTSAIEALQLIVLAWKFFGPIVPDQGSVSGSAAALITNYFKRVSSNPKLVKSLRDYGPLEPLKSVYFPNPEYYHLIDTLNIQKVSDPEIIRKLTGEGEDLFEGKYKAQKEIINNFGI